MCRLHTYFSQGEKSADELPEKGIQTQNLKIQNKWNFKKSVFLHLLLTLAQPSAKAEFYYKIKLSLSWTSSFVIHKKLKDCQNL